MHLENILEQAKIFHETKILVIKKLGKDTVHIDG